MWASIRVSGVTRVVQVHAKPKASAELDGSSSAELNLPRERRNQIVAMGRLADRVAGAPAPAGASLRGTGSESPEIDICADEHPVVSDDDVSALFEGCCVHAP